MPLTPVRVEHNAWRRYTKALTVIQIVLTAVAVMGLVVEFELALRVHQKATSDQARKVAQERARDSNRILKYAVFVPWLVFTAAHVGLRLGLKLQPKIG